MKRLRSEDLSLHHYLRTYALRDFIETERSVPLEFSPDMSQEGSYVYTAVVESDMRPISTSRGRGWVYLDEPFPVCSGAGFLVQEQSDAIVVYDALGGIIDPINYMVDYVDGRIVMPNRNLSPAFIDYKWYYVALVNDWDVLENSGVPIVAVDISSTNKEGFQLGGGRYVKRRVDLYVFGTDQANRDDVGESIYDALYLRSCANQTFSKGTILDWDGTFNLEYVYDVFLLSSTLKFENVRMRNTWPDARLMIPSRDQTMMSELNRYRTTISFELYHYEEAS